MYRLQMSEKKSPITDKLLRQPGQSISDMLLEILFEKILSYYFMAVFFVVLAAVEWVQYWTDASPNPWLFTVFAIGVSAFAYFRIDREFKKAKNHRLGRDGERAVGEFLDRLRANGYRVYHDIPGDGWNIDHVIISTRGVYTIETKTRSKPPIGEAKILFDGNAISVDGGPQDERPIRQSLAQAKQMRTILKEATGRDFPVQPVVVYPGWYVEQKTDNLRPDVWVLNPKALHKWIEHQDESIPFDQVKQAATALAKYVRAYDA